MTWDERRADDRPRLLASGSRSCSGPRASRGEPSSTEHARGRRRLAPGVLEEAYLHLVRTLWERTRHPAHLPRRRRRAERGRERPHPRRRRRSSDVYIQPAAGDSGTALGAAFDVWHQVLGGRAAS